MNTNRYDAAAEFALLRPTDEGLDRDWTQPRREAVLGRVVAETTADTAAAGKPMVRRPLSAATSSGDRPRRVPRRRILIAAGAVAAAAAVLLAVPLIAPADGPAGPTSAAALEALAHTAATEPALASGQLRHLVVTATQSGLAERTLESWTDPNGQVWRRDTQAGTATFYEFPAGDMSLNNPSPAFLATLPTAPAELANYLRANVSGSNSTDEAVFVAVGDLLRGGFAPPALRSAALTMLKTAPHVTATETNDARGHAAVAVTFDDQSVRAGVSQTLYFDPATARIVQEQSTWPDGTFTSVTTQDNIVTAIPADVLRFVSSNGTCLIDGAVQSPDACVHAIYQDGPGTTAAEAAATSVAPVPAGGN